MENSESVTGTCAQQQHCVYGTTSGMTPNGTGQKLFEKTKNKHQKVRGKKKEVSQSIRKRQISLFLLSNSLKVSFHSRNRQQTRLIFLVEYLNSIIEFDV
jgi:hypothetical protein